ncbi:MAG TPA: hypothetical protein DDY69_01680, partial [Deltaproteobacteria bacterium]|nr:hypothetical protein [Deltaproteobacteria bacterium]
SITNSPASKEKQMFSRMERKPKRLLTRSRLKRADMLEKDIKDFMLSLDWMSFIKNKFLFLIPNQDSNEGSRLNFGEFP